MFFVGLILGIGCCFLAKYLYLKYNIFGWSIFVIGIIDILLLDASTSAGIGMVVGVVGSIVFIWLISKKVEEKKPSKPKSMPISYYKSHCWHCGNQIDGSWNKQCPDCKKYYICPNCGACKCDYGKDPPFKH